MGVAMQRPNTKLKNLKGKLQKGGNRRTKKNQDRQGRENAQ